MCGKWGEGVTRDCIYPNPLLHMPLWTILIVPTLIYDYIHLKRLKKNPSRKYTEACLVPTPLKEERWGWMTRKSRCITLDDTCSIGYISCSLDSGSSLIMLGTIFVWGQGQQHEGWLALLAWLLWKTVQLKYLRGHSQSESFRYFSAAYSETIITSYKVL